MIMETNLNGRLRNTLLVATGGLMPLFEAVVNSIHAIEEAALPMAKGRITVTVLRGTQQSLAFNDDIGTDNGPTKEPILGFRIADNGIGFNDGNMASFRTLDSEHKVTKGGRGVGRLLWLKAFKRVSVDSVFAESKGKRKRRTFTFTATQGVNVRWLRSGGFRRGRDNRPLKGNPHERKGSFCSRRRRGDTVLEIAISG